MEDHSAFSLPNKTYHKIYKMKAVPYSPFNRTYKYLCLQNQLAHNKNKNKVRGLVDSNLSLNKKDILDISATTRRSEQKCNTNTSFYSYGSSCDQVVGRLKKQPLTIHKNSKLNRYRSAEIDQENSRLNRKISQTKCRVTPFNSTESDYKKSVSYRTIAMRYNQQTRQNKDLVFFASPSLTSEWAYSDPNTRRYLCNKLDPMISTHSKSRTLNF